MPTHQKRKHSSSSTPIDIPATNNDTNDNTDTAMTHERTAPSDSTTTTNDTATAPDADGVGAPSPSAATTTATAAAISGVEPKPDVGSSEDAAAAALTKAQSDYTALLRVSHRLAMVESTSSSNANANSSKLEAVLDKLLPRLLRRVGDNHQHQVALSLNNDGVNDTATQHQTAVLLQHSHAKLIEMLSHAMTRVQDEDRQCGLPCQAILDLLVLVPSSSTTGSSSNSSCTSSSLDTVDVYTLNLSLAFLGVGMPRITIIDNDNTNPEQNRLLPSVLLLAEAIRRRCFVGTTASSSSSPSQQPYYNGCQAVQVLLDAITGLVPTTTPSITTAKLAVHKSPNNGISTPSTLTRTPNFTLGDRLDPTRRLLDRNPAVARALFDILLDVLLLPLPPPTNATTSTSLLSLPPPGFSSAGIHSMPCSSNNNTSWLLKVLNALLEAIDPLKRTALFAVSNSCGAVKEDTTISDVNNNSGGVSTTTTAASLNLARTTVLLVVASGHSQPFVAERAAAILKQHCDTKPTTTTIRSASHAATTPLMTATTTTRLGDALALAHTLLTLCLGQVHSEAMVPPIESSSSMTVSAVKRHNAWLGGIDSDYTNATPQQILTTKRRAVDEATIGTVAMSFVANKILLENPTLWHKDTTQAVDVAILVVQVAHRTLASSPLSLSNTLTKLRAKPYMAAAELLNIVAIRLTALLDSTVLKGSPSILTTVEDLLARCIVTACGVLAPVAASSPNVSTFTMRMVAGNNEGSVSVRDLCYGVLATVSRSKFALSTNSRLFTCGDAAQEGTSVWSHSVRTASMLFRCASNEEDRLRPRAVAALDSLLSAYCRACPVASVTKIHDEVSVTTDLVSISNPWLSYESKEQGMISTPLDTTGDECIFDRQCLVKSLIPLLWHSAQSSQPKATRVAASRWASKLLRGLDINAAFQLLCFLAGDADATVSSTARDGMGLPAVSGANDDDDALAFKRSDYTTRSLPDFGAFTHSMFQDAPSTRLQLQFRDFTSRGKSATLRCGLYCLLNDLYGGEDAAVKLYIAAISETVLEMTSNSTDFGGASSSGLSNFDLLDECSACLLATLSASLYARMQIVSHKDTKTLSLDIRRIESLAISSNSSRARRYFAGACGKLLESPTIWTHEGQNSNDPFEHWVSETQISTSLNSCSIRLAGISDNSSIISQLHGSAFLGAHISRAFIILADACSITQNDTWNSVAAVLDYLGEGVTHPDDMVAHACIDSLGIALSYDGPNAPVLNARLYLCTASILRNLTKTMKLFGHGDSVNQGRALKIVRTAGICLAATTTGSGIVRSRVESSSDGSLGLMRTECVDALFDLLGSLAARKEEEINIAVGEALADYSDAYSPENVKWSQCKLNDWPVEFDASYANQLPPHEHVLYVLLRRIYTSSNPQKITACAPALLAVVARGANRVSPPNFQNFKWVFPFHLS